MKRYFKKSEILREMGKNPKDIRLLDRMIARGEIIEDRGRYRFVDDPIVDNPVEVDNNPVGDTSDLDFQIQENERLEGEKQELIEGIKKAFIYFGRGTQWSEFIEKIGVSSLLWDMELE